MTFDLERFITRTKLSELFEQQKSLIQAYRQIEEKAAEVNDPIEKNKALYEGLSELTFADKPLHPKIRIDMFPTFLDLIGTTDVGFMGFWSSLLGSELQLGRARATINAIYGSLLEEKVTKEHPSSSQKSQEELEELLQPLLIPNSTVNIDWYKSYLKTNTPIELRLSEKDDRFQRSMDVGFLTDLLTPIRTNPYRPTEIRNQISRIIENKKLIKEFSDAVTIMLEHLYEWDWGDTSAYSIRFGKKRRLLLDETLPDAVIIRAIGERWGMLYGESYRSQPTRWRFDLKEERIWSETGFVKTDIAAQSAYREPTIRQTRLNKMNQISQKVWQINYTIEDETSGAMLAVSLIHAEIEHWKAAFPGQPLWILKYDIKDFYPSLSHELILTTLKEKSVLEKDIELIRRWLKVKVTNGESEISLQNGLPNDRTLSHFLGEAYLTEVERYIYDGAPVQIIRIVDDITILAASEADGLLAGQRLEEFLAQTGLELNQSKSGAAVVNGEKSERLPAGLPSWKYVALSARGEWTINRTAIDDLRELTYAEIRNIPDIFAKVEVYNTRLKDIVENIGLQLVLGAQQLQEAETALQAFHNEIMHGQGIQAYLRAEILGRVAGIAEDFELPAAWFYWPSTAGGLGLLQPMIYIIAYQNSKKWQRFTNKPNAKQKSADWQNEPRVNWIGYFNHCLQVYKMGFTFGDPQFMQLEKDFINRGGEISGKSQDRLSTYWRWVLKIYGPQIQEELGSFRFLITELVPLQVIVTKEGLEEA